MEKRQYLIVVDRMCLTRAKYFGDSSKDRYFSGSILSQRIGSHFSQVVIQDQSEEVECAALSVVAQDYHMANQLISNKNIEINFESFQASVLSERHWPAAESTLTPIVIQRLFEKHDRAEMLYVSAHSASTVIAAKSFASLGYPVTLFHFPNSISSVMHPDLENLVNESRLPLIAMEWRGIILWDT